MNGPSKDVKEFQLKLNAKLQIFPSDQKVSVDSPLNLVATGSKYGLIFAGHPTGFMCIGSNSVLGSGDSRRIQPTTEFPRRDVYLGCQPTHLDVNADNEILAVVVIIQDLPVLQIYSTASFGSNNLVKKLEVRMSNTPGVRVSDIQWNPAITNMIGAVLSDGSAVVFECKDSSVSLNSIPPNAQATCLCWSPKGKQVVIGARNGSLTQYKPELKAVKTFAAPTANMYVVSVHWLSSFQFIAAYKNLANPSDRPVVVIVNVPKNNPVSYVSYEDICFTCLSKRPEYYFIHQQTWNLVIVGCGDSMELSILGSESNGANWIHWKQDDNMRAELPLADDKSDVHNVGIAIDLSPSQPVPINDSLTIGPMPVILTMSHVGVLCLYTALNMFPGVPTICSAPQPLMDQSGLHLFTVPFQLKEVEKQQPSFPGTGAVTAPSAAVAQPQTHATPAQASVQPTPTPVQPVSMFSQASLQPSQNTFSQPTPVSFSQPPRLTQPVSAFSLATSSQPPIPQPVISVPPQSTALKVPLLPNPTVTSSVSQSGKLFPSEPALISQTSLKPDPPNAPEQTSVPSGFNFGVTPGDLTKQDSPGQAEVKPSQEVEKESLPPNLSRAIPEEPEVPEVDDSVYTSVIHDELAAFKEEFVGVKQYLSSIDFKVAEKQLEGKIKIEIESYENFSAELVDTTLAQQSEVNCLRANLLDVISWLQCIKTKDQLLKNPRLIEMRDAEDLDPISKQRLKTIEQHLYYIQSQLKQAAAHLDSLKRIQNGKTGLPEPTLHTVLQIITKHTDIINTQKGVLSDIEEKVSDRINKIHQKKNKFLTTKSEKRSSVEDSQLSSLAHKLLETKLGSNEDVPCSYRESSKRIIALCKNSAKYNAHKEKILRDWHKKHKILNSKIIQRSLNESDSSLPDSIKSSSKKETSNLELTPAKKESSNVFDNTKITTYSISPERRDAEPKTLPVSRNLFSVSKSDLSITSVSSPIIKTDLKTLIQLGETSTPLNTIKEKSIEKSVPVSNAVPLVQPLPQKNTFSALTTTSPLVTVSTSASTILSVPPKGSSSFTFASPANLTTNFTPQTSVYLAPKFDKSLTKETGTKVSEAVTITSQSNLFSSNSNSAFNFTGAPTSSKEITTTSNPVSTSVSSTTGFPKSSPKGATIFGGFGFGSAKTSLSSSNLDKEVKGNVFDLSQIASSVTSPNKEINNEASSVQTSQPVNFKFSVGIPVIPVTTVASSSNFSFSFDKSTVTSNENTTNNIFSQATVTSVPASTPTFSLSVTPNSSPAVSVTSSGFTTGSTLVTTPSPISFVTSSAVATTAATPITTTPLTHVTTPQPVVTTSSVIIQTPPKTTTTMQAASFPSTTSSTLFSQLSFGSSSTAAPSTTTTTTTITTTTTTTITTASTVTTIPTTGTASSTASTSAPLFGTTSSFTSFGTGSSTTSAANIFGSAALKFTAAATTSAPSIFGQPTTTTSPSLFVQSTTAPSSTTTSTLFGQAQTTTASTIFGQPTTTSSNLFGQPATPSTSASLFGQVTQTTAAAPLFGSTMLSFGSPTFASAPVFGSPTKTTAGFGSPPTFGSPTTAPSVFGSPASTTTSSSIFGTPVSTTTSSNMFGTPTSSRMFGFQPSSTTTSSVFGTPLMGQTVTQTSPFGAATPPANPFFGSSGGNVFNQSTSSGNFGSSGGSLFGGNSTFGSPSQGQFQQSGGNIFGGSGSGMFSNTGGQTVSQSGFGSPPSFQQPKPGGFGSGPVFGSAPAFGGAPAFGSSPTFSTANTVFGSASPSGGSFGESSGNMFESLANQNTMTFGNLAQSQQAQQMTGFGSPQNQSQQPSTFGGNAFTSWR